MMAVIDAPLCVYLSMSPFHLARGTSAVRAQGCGYAGGSLCLRLPWAYLFMKRPQIEAEGHKAKTLLRGITAQVLHVMLTQTERARHRNVSTLLRHLGELFYCNSAAPGAAEARSLAGGLIQAASGRDGCLGGWRTKRSGCAA